ncbi:acetate/propionate family kinase [Alteromonas lipolytica]|uniref:Acetate kinase n=1 Tax=Alteromonas lipolytica TaxID=1856405 RepID=A0A1E8F8J1_9ALTE|nr:acetate/propionate family kinase [Alteromonas lipolytica]OFI32237.1 hypothetical protein BFC17_08450 [Alteromonas lipolytica]GGF82738.1 acetate kinase [Alteromonas lipolytica]
MNTVQSEPHYLILNSGSSTLKYAVFNAANLEVLERGVFELTATNYAETLEEVLHHGGYVTAVGHRVVHGGTAYTDPLLINDASLQALDELCELAPLHQPHNLHAVKVLRELHPELTQVACFDTAFHQTQPPLHTRYAIPARLSDQGIRRYGFHGLSYDYISRQLARHTANQGGKAVVLHLGSGASGCAMLNGKSISSTMGFTALDGLMMATRCGTIDPGLVLHCVTQLNMSATDVTNMLYKESGLQGSSGISGDMRKLIEQSDNQAATDAIALYCHYIVRAVGSLCAELQGLDSLVFTAGVGENQPLIRQQVADKLSWLGVELDEQANQAGELVISTAQSAVKVMVIATNEEWIIAHQMKSLLGH